MKDSIIKKLNILKNSGGYLIPRNVNTNPVKILEIIVTKAEFSVLLKDNKEIVSKLDVETLCNLFYI